MVRIFVRRSRDASYLTRDSALELGGVRDGPAGWWLDGAGDPHDTQRVSEVLQGSSRSHVVGYDLVVAAPRPASILVALDPDAAPAVVLAHRAAVHDAVDYLRERATVMRLRAGQVDEEVLAKGSDVVSFTHGVNRYGDPHVHDHVLIGSAVAGLDRVIDGRALFAHAHAADAIYRARLRHEISTTTPYRAWRNFEGREGIEGLDEGWLALWSGGHTERGVKYQWRRDEMIDHWAQTSERFVSLGEMTSPPRRRDLDEHAFGAVLEGITTLTRRNLVHAWSDAARDGTTYKDVQAAMATHYPELESSRGLREDPVLIRRARQTSLVRERGPRPLRSEGLEQWRHRDRELSLDGWSRSR